MALSFGQRLGLKPIPSSMQTSSMTPELKNGLWNVFDEMFWEKARTQGGFYTERRNLYLKLLWRDFFKEPVDLVTQASVGTNMAIVRKSYFEYGWLDSYEFVEFTADFLFKSVSADGVYNRLNFVLETELSSYRFVNGALTDITSEIELELLESTLNNSEFKGVTNHLQRALELYSDKKSPDYRNSIKESISAVESMAKIVTGNKSSTLGQALKVISKNGKVHTALLDGFDSLYGYTSNEGGIRHAMLDEPNIRQEDAKYFLLSCTSFVNYLKSKL